MTALAWDAVGERLYETGVDHGVLYIPDDEGVYQPGVAWNGLVTLTEAPSGAAATAQWADNTKYLNLISAEEFGGTIDAFTYPDEFNQFDGLATPTAGVLVGQQTRKTFGLSYRTKVGNDVDFEDHGYKLHLVYGVAASPSQKAFGTINDTPAPISFSWTFTTTPVAVGGLKPTSLLVLDSTELDPTTLADLLTILYGSEGVAPRLPLPDEIITMFEGSVTQLVPTIPTYDNGTHTLTIPTQSGMTYYMDGAVVTAGAHVITETKIVHARPNAGFMITPGHIDEWEFDYS